MSAAYVVQSHVSLQHWQSVAGVVPHSVPFTTAEQLTDLQDKMTRYDMLQTTDSCLKPAKGAEVAWHAAAMWNKRGCDGMTGRFFFEVGNSHDNDSWSR